MFTSRPQSTDLGLLDRSGRVWRELSRPLRYESPTVDITVPAGFLTDHASVPRFFWRMFPSDGPWNAAAILHDYLYSVNADCPKGNADRIFLEAMGSEGVKRWKRTAMFLAVRWFGGWAYHSR